MASTLNVLGVISYLIVSALAIRNDASPLVMMGAAIAMLISEAVIGVVINSKNDLLPLVHILFSGVRLTIIVIFVMVV